MLGEEKKRSLGGLQFRLEWGIEEKALVGSVVAFPAQTQQLISLRASKKKKVT